jgi:hypothetical protein
MLAGFLAWSVSTPFLLTDSNYSLGYHISNHSGLFLAFWGSDCPSCPLLRDSWDHFSEKSPYCDRVTIAETDCSVSPTVCSQFGHFPLPHIVYVSFPSNKTTVYHGSFDEEEYSDFLDHQLSLPLDILSPDTDVSSSGNWSSFLFTFVDKSDEKFETTRLSFVAFRSIGCHFYAIPGTRWSLSAIRAPRFTKPFKGAWHVSEIRSFVQGNAFPLMTELDGDNGELLKENDIATLLGFLIPSESLQEFTRLAEETESPFPFMYVPYQSSDPRMQEFGVDPEHLPHIILLDLKNSRWVPYDGARKADSLAGWLKKLDFQTMAWHGPHESLSDGWRHMWMASAPMFKLFSLGVLGYGLWRAWNWLTVARPINRRSSDFTFAHL